MKKVFTLLALFCFALTAALAQTFPSNDAVYTIDSKMRGYVYASSSDSYLNSTWINCNNVEATTHPKADGTVANNQFAFLKADGSTKVYMYSVGAGKFCTQSGTNVTLTDEPTDAVTLTASDNYYAISFSSGHELNLTNWDGNAQGVRVADSYPYDGGNLMTINSVSTTVDLSAAIAKVEALENGGTVTSPVVTNWSELVNTRAYTLVCQRGALTTNSTNLKSTSDLGQSVDPTNTAQHFALITPDEGTTYYLYSVGQSKFVGKGGALSDTPANPVLHTNGVGDNTFVLYFANDNFINIGGNNQIVVNGWGPGGTVSAGCADIGNSFTITSVAEFNPADALAHFAPATPIVESGKLYRIKNRCMDLSYITNSDNSTLGDREDGNGAYLSSTQIIKEGFQFLQNDTRFTDCTTTSLADAGCVWMIEGSDAEGWTIKNMNTGLYIDDTRAGSGGLYVANTANKADAAVFTITKNAEGYILFEDADYGVSQGNFLHAMGAGLQVWSADARASQWEIHPATELQVALTEASVDANTTAKWATLHLPFAVEFTNNSTSTITVNTVSVDGNTATLNPLNITTNALVPANTGVILQASTSNDVASFAILPADNDYNSYTVEGNALTGTNTVVELDGTNNANYFVLGRGGENNYVGLRNPNETVTKIGANKAYYYASTPATNMLYFVVGGEQTAIQTVEKAEENAPIYDLSGRRVLNTLKGNLYIKSGKKFIAQ